MHRFAFWLCCVAFAAAADTPPPVLRVEAATLAQDTGTMHYVDRLRVGYGVAELVLASNEADGVRRPIPGPQYPIGDKDVVLLGWSSSGGGMMTLHAMLFHADGDTIALTSELSLTGDRPNTALLVRRDGAGRLLLGVPMPPETVHEPDDWSLQLGDGHAPALNIDRIRKLRFVDGGSRPADLFYAPPSNAAKRPARVAWLVAGPKGFSVSEAAK